ncbi:hypothetical protein O0L34_g10687 [Tuta absoluta]|nr:hypothetical protein O0L34_g10687 [Tuta absoluta]
MWRLLVLILSASCVLCLTVTPDMLVPMKEYNEACGYDACSIPLSEDGINVHIVPYTHYELGFERTFDEHYTGNDPEWAHSNVNMKQTLDSVITELWMKANRRFALANIPYLFHWWSQRDDTVRQMVYTLIRQGRLVLIGGGWSMADEATTNYHAIIDSHTFSLRKINATFWECGRPLVAWQADVMGHSREFASLAAQMGYDALFINPISFDDELQRMQRWALEMLWRGSDDLGPKSDIFTHKLFDGYWSPPGFCFSSLCQDPLIVTSDLAFNNVEERAQTFVDVIYNRQAPNYNTSHVMVMMGHVNGYFDAPMWFANIDALINAVNARSTTGKQKMYVFYSTPACYAKAVHESK